jgi:hypothetical protein
MRQAREGEKMNKIEAVQDQGYGKWEFDLLDMHGYVGLMIGTETRQGIIWEIQERTPAGDTGAILRLPVMTKTEALKYAEMMLVK